MDALPALPEPFPQLDFPATEQLRQAMVREYRAMLADLQQAVGHMLEGFVEPVVKAEAAVGAALSKQNRRRQTIVSILRRLGVPEAEFAASGRYANTSDEALRLEAKRLLAEARSAGDSRV